LGAWASDQSQPLNDRAELSQGWKRPVHDLQAMCRDLRLGVGLSLCRGKSNSGKINPTGCTTAFFIAGKVQSGRRLGSIHRTKRCRARLSRRCAQLVAHPPHRDEFGRSCSSGGTLTARHRCRLLSLDPCFQSLQRK